MLNLYRLCITIVASALFLYGGVCVLWGVFYHSAQFELDSAIERRDISPGELEPVLRLFAEKAEHYGELVPRDASGLYTADTGDVLDRAKTIYREIEKKHAFLSGEELRPKPMLFSKFMSYINFTGFFFPFTGEANLNIDSPICLLPSTAAHEIAHQRGVAPEDEANFTAVIACLDSGDAEFAYSGALLGYIHLSNALYSTDYELWCEIGDSLSPEVRADLDSNNEYWAKYETKAADISESVYTGFLQSHGDSRGMRSYGACVDLLVTYYYEEAMAFNKS